MTGCHESSGLARKLRWPVLCVGFATLLLTDIARAATEIPPSAEPERIEQEIQPRVTPRAQPEGPAEVTPQPIPPGAEQVRFVLKDIQFQGATALPAADLRRLYASLIGKEVSLADIFGVAQRATVAYRNAGYILSTVVVPPQEVQDGVVRLEVVEGFIDKVTIQGDVRGRRELIEAYGQKIAQSRPLKAETLERYLLLTGDLAGVTARGVLTPSATVVGASDLAIVLEHDPFEGTVSIDNRGSKFIGRWILVAGGSVNSLLGLYERISLVAATNPFDVDELKFGEISGAVPVGTEGTTVNVSYSASESEPGFTLEDDDIDSTSQSLILGASHPFIRTRERNLTGAVAFEIRQLDTDADDDQIIDDRLRVLRLRGTYDFVDDLLGINLLDLELSQGLNLFNATEDDDTERSRANADGVFTKLAGTASRLQSLGELVPGLAVYAAVTGQISSDELLSSEEFGLGGSAFGRGYDPSEITGDHGIGTTLELQYGQSTDTPWLDFYQLYGFYDFGAVWNDNDPDGDSRDSLASVGVGVQVGLVNSLSANLELARQLTRVSESSSDNQNDTRVLFSLTGDF